MYPYRPDLPDPSTERRDRIATPSGVLAVAVLCIGFAALQPMDDAAEPPKPRQATEPASARPVPVEALAAGAPPMEADTGRLAAGPAIP